MLICLQTPAFTPPAPITAPLFGAGDQQRPQQQQQQQPSPVGRYLCVTPTVLSVISTPYLTCLIRFSLPGMPQGAPPAPGVPSMMPPGGGPPGAPPSYGDAAPQQRAQVHDGSPPPSPHATMPHPYHVITAQVNSA